MKKKHTIFEKFLMILLTISLVFSSFPVEAIMANVTRANVDLAYNALSQSISSGQTAEFQLDVKFAGALEEASEGISGSQLVVTLPAEDTYVLQNSLEELSIKASYSDASTVPAEEAIIPVKTGNVLTWNFPNAKTGISERLVIKLLAKNGLVRDGSVINTRAELTAPGVAFPLVSEASTTVNAKAFPSISKAYKGKADDPSISFVSPNTNVRYEIKTNFYSEKVGLIFAKPGSEIVITETLPLKTTWVSDTSGVVPERTMVNNR